MPSGWLLRESFQKAVAGAGLKAADRLCERCVDLLDIDGAALSVLPQGSVWGTLGASGGLSRRVDELQFTFGEGPCMDAVNGASPVVVPDLGDPSEARWPAFTVAVLELGVRSVIALPVTVEGSHVGALELFRFVPGPITSRELDVGLVAADVAGPTIAALIRPHVDWDHDSNEELRAAPWERVEVYQATGMIMGQLSVGPVEALMRLRGHAFAHGMTASETAWAVVDRRITLDDDGPAAFQQGVSGSE